MSISTLEADGKHQHMPSFLWVCVIMYYSIIFLEISILNPYWERTDVISL